MPKSLNDSMPFYTHTMTEPEWCTCRRQSSYSSLRDDLNTFVCAACRKPSFLVWQGHEKICPECDCSFSSPWESLCPACKTAILELATLVQQDDPAAASDLRVRTGTTLAWHGWTEARLRVENSPFCKYARD